MGEQAGQIRRPLQVFRQKNLPGQDPPRAVILDQERRENLLHRLPCSGEDLQVPPGQFPALEVEHRHHRTHRADIQAQHVGVRQKSSHHLLPLSQEGNGPQPVPQGGGLFKLQVLCGGLHLGAQVLLHLAELPLQQVDGLVDGLVVLAAGDLFAAVAVALAHVEVQARPLLPLVPGEGLAAAGQFQGCPESVQDGLGIMPAAKGAEVPGPVVRHPPLDGKLGIGGPHRQANVGISLVILQQNVVPGLVPLDEGVLQHQGLKL